MKTIEVIRSMTLPVSETMQVPAYFKSEYNTYLIIKEQNLGMYIDDKIRKIEITSHPIALVTRFSMVECDENEALKSFNNVLDKFYKFLV